MGFEAGSMNAEGEAVWIYGKWVQAPAQDRSERTFFRFLDAAEQLLAGRHWHEVSVQEIVRRAKASVGSFYNRFSDKTALLHCLDDRLGLECEVTIHHLMTELEACPALIVEMPGIVISLLIRLCTERRGVIRALDLAQKMSAADSFSGLGPRFDTALETLSAFMREHDEQFAAYSSSAIALAFREVFWLARENLLYENPDMNERALHKSLLHHFEASLKDKS
ncbi:helix-turn-helix domain-containing protein [Kordiimonas pumila]|uniref:Helix-turn-helix domain-containing protein n=1 Tax=Kordiimonas pumila TaxID=2161677 RepID=A0ABV7D4N6_9PROT|nr:TetR/AcrR family transcriptional regulator [Kordiimonas pumila]